MPETEYFVRWRGKVAGPFDLARLKTMIRQGQLSKQHQISTDETNWVPAGEISELYPHPRDIPSPVVAEEPPVNDRLEDEKETLPALPDPPPQPVPAAADLKPAPPELPAQAAPLTRCRYCGEDILWGARKCKHCGEFVYSRPVRPADHPTKNPGLAAVLSFFYLGLGQIYNGHLAKGFFLCFCPAAFSLFFFLILLPRLLDADSSLRSASAGVIACLIAYIVLWIFGIVDAYQSAEEINRSRTTRRFR